MSNPPCPKCGKDCGWMDRYLYRCGESLESEHYIPLFPMVNQNGNHQ